MKRDSVTKRYKVLDVREYTVQGPDRKFILILENASGRIRIKCESFNTSKKSEHDIVVPGDEIELRATATDIHIVYCVSIINTERETE